VTPPTPPRLLPGQTAYHVLRRNRRGRIGLVVCGGLALLSQSVPADLRPLLAIAAAIGVGCCGMVVVSTMQSFGRIEDTERSLGYATLERERNADLWLLDPNSGAVVRPPLEGRTTTGGLNGGPPPNP
jgi:hypothetical protein